MKMKKTFAVDGMKCMHCKANVENALQSLKGVNAAEVDLDKKNVTVDYDEKIVSVNDFQRVVSESGNYELVG